MRFSLQDFMRLAIMALGAVQAATFAHAQLVIDFDNPVAPELQVSIAGFNVGDGIGDPPGGSGNEAYFNLVEGVISAGQIDVMHVNGGVFQALEFALHRVDEGGGACDQSEYDSLAILLPGGVCLPAPSNTQSIASFDLSGYGVSSFSIIYDTVDAVVNTGYFVALDNVVMDVSLPWKKSPINGHWYQEIKPLTWAGAEEQAVAWGGHLSTLRYQAENDWLASTFYGDGSPLWIGYNDADVEGVFVWSSGENPGYENWSAGQPDDKNGADWAALVPSSSEWLDETFLPERRSVVEVISDDCDSDGRPDAFEIAVDPGLDWNGDGILDVCKSANYCVAENNSNGVPAAIGASGTPVASENDFTLEAWDLPLNEFAYFLASESTAFVPKFGGSSGNLCLGPPQIRFNNPNFGGAILNSGSTGTVSFTLDLNNLPQNITFDPGEIWYFQLWYRDFIASGPTSNTTDGIEVMFR